MHFGTLQPYPRPYSQLSSVLHGRVFSTVAMAGSSRLLGKDYKSIPTTSWYHRFCFFFYLVCRLVKQNCCWGPLGATWACRMEQNLDKNCWFTPLNWSNGTYNYFHNIMFVQGSHAFYAHMLHEWTWSCTHVCKDFCPIYSNLPWYTEPGFICIAKHCKMYGFSVKTWENSKGPIFNIKVWIKNSALSFF